MTKILNFGSLNYDHIYELDHFVMPKETLSSNEYSRGFGGKGLNQSIALRKAGLKVYQAGKVGYDGEEFITYLKKNKVDTSFIKLDNKKPSGHAIIEVVEGQNRIVLYGGTNIDIDKKQIDKTLKQFNKDDILLIQNEINNIEYLINKAKEKQMFIVFNVAPFSDLVLTYPMHKVDLIFVNEIEAQALAQINTNKYEYIIDALKHKFTDQEIIMTVGEQGSYYIKGKKVLHQKAYKSKVVDTTAAGDTFTAYYLMSYLKGKDVRTCLKIASKAASVTVSRKGAAKSIPTLKELV